MIRSWWPAIRLVGGPPVAEAAAPPNIPAQVDVLRAHIDKVEAQRDAAFADAVRARAEADALRARLAAWAGTPELARAHKTLIDYEGMLATCRDQHGGNSRSGARGAFQ